ncbi:hypothetical protein ACFY0F_23605 [Streptomyces sp. NPDC001544]|uniref:hypothetical protein n=1 Tax=Streptomyces sp. NPDC001544 TaxID=3364584 RepID=UPI003692B1BE
MAAVHPTRDKGRRAFDWSCDCGKGSGPVPTPAEANAQREEHQRTQHDQPR